MVTERATSDEQVMARIQRLERRREYLLLLRRDLARREYAQLEPIYALDFSEVMAYIAPVPALLEPDSYWHDYCRRFSFRSPDTSVILDILGQQKATLFLPIGSIYELRQFLRHFYPHQLGRSSLDESIDQFRGLDSLRAKMTTLKPEEWDIKDALALVKPSDQLARLHHLYVKLCQSAASVTNQLGPPDLDTRAFLTAVNELTKARPEYPPQNRVDAINYAMVAHFSSSWADHHKVCYMVTRRRPLEALQSIPWDSDPLDRYPAVASAEGRVDSLARDVTYLGYAVLADIAKPQLTGRIEFVERKLTQTEAMLSEMRSTTNRHFYPSLSPQLRRRQHHAAEEAALADMFEVLAAQLAEENVALPQVISIEQSERARDIVEAQYNSLSEQLTQDIEAYSALARKVKGDQRDYVAGLVENPVTDVKFSPSDSGDSWQISPADESKPLAELVVHGTFFELRAMTRSGRLEWFVRLAADLFFFMSALEASRALRMRMKLLPPGILVEYKRAVTFIPMKEFSQPLDAGELWDACLQSGDIPTRFRFSSPYFDLHYRYFTPRLRETTCALITHMAVPPLLATFIARTTQRLFDLPQVERSFDRFCSTHLASFSPYFD